jgi:hypothetical protein
MMKASIAILSVLLLAAGAFALSFQAQDIIQDNITNESVQEIPDDIQNPESVQEIPQAIENPGPIVTDTQGEDVMIRVTQTSENSDLTALVQVGDRTATYIISRTVTGQALINQLEQLTGLTEEQVEEGLRRATDYSNEPIPVMPVQPETPPTDGPTGEWESDTDRMAKLLQALTCPAR